MNILFVIPDFYPNENASANCVLEFAQELLKDQNQVYVLSRRTSFDVQTYEMYKGTCIIRVTDYANAFVDKSRSKKNRGLSTLYFFIGAVIKIFYKLEAKLSRHNSSAYWEKVIENKIKQLMNKYKFDTIVSVSAAMFTSLAVAKVKKKDANSFKFIFYQTDPYSNNVILPTKDFKVREKKEMKILEVADKIITTKLIYKENTRNNFKKYIDKSIPLELPIIRERQYPYSSDFIVFNDNFINCAYVGIFYPKIRSCNYLIELFNSMDDNNIILHLIGVSEKDIPNMYKSMIGKCIKVYGRVSSQVAYKAMQDADILINLGNSINNQLPSKTLDYISTGNPIVNISRIEECATFDYINKYPLKLKIFENTESIEEDAQKIEIFCCGHKNKQIPFSEIRKLYEEDTMENVCEQFLGQIYSLCGN